MSDVPCRGDCGIIELERELQTPECRGDEARLRVLLAPDFLEIGASGRRWDREAVLDLLARESRTEAVPIEVSELGHRHLAGDVVQVFWESEREGRRARRSSLWCLRPAGWQQVFHQGTLV